MSLRDDESLMETAHLLRHPKNAMRLIGKPEPLKFNFSGYWSRRIDDEHRVVYKVVDDEVILAQLRGHDD